MKRLALLLLLLAAPVSAQRAPTDAELATFSGPRATVEARIDADFNGDGRIDTAFVENGNDLRALHVLVASGKSGWGLRDHAGRHELDSGALGPAELSFARNILIVKDLTGGTSAIEATYRYRWDAATRKMRLIGLDASSYSRTFQHDTYEISWNLLTGTFVTSYMKLKPEGSKGDEAYFDPVVKTRKRASPAIYVDATPNPEDVINAEKWPD